MSPGHSGEGSARELTLSPPAPRGAQPTGCLLHTGGESLTGELGTREAGASLPAWRSLFAPWRMGTAGWGGGRGTSQALGWLWCGSSMLGHSAERTWVIFRGVWAGDTELCWEEGGVYVTEKRGIICFFV